MLRRALFVATSLTFLTSASSAAADGVPHASSWLRLLGARAPRALAPNHGSLAALVRLAEGQRAEDLGLEAVVPGIARLRGAPSALTAFAAAHPGLAMEVAPPVHTLMDKAGVFVNAVAARNNSGLDGTGTLVGVADTGIDVTHLDMRDATGHTRVAWLLDLSLPPRGKYPDLEQKFGIKDSAGNLAFGAVFAAADIDLLLAAGTGSGVPQDEVGHGTHVTSIAAGNGGLQTSVPPQYIGIAPGAQIIFARVTAQGGGDSIDNDDLVRGVQFIFDRADTMGLPVAANLSIGSDFGPHDGTMIWEQTLASFVGPDKPGHALVAAAGNSGSIAEMAIHQNVHVTSGLTTRVPVSTNGATDGGVQIWVSMRAGASLKIGLESPTGTWIDPTAPGSETGYNQNEVNAGVINGSSLSDSPVPAGSNGAVVLWQGRWPSGTYDVTLEGDGTADLYLQAVGDATAGDNGGAQFGAGVRQGTINLPATHPGIIGVGCSVNRVNWMSIDQSQVGLQVPVLDQVGGLPDPSGVVRHLTNGEICWFSSAGPTVTGVAKPEITAPGGVVVAAMSAQAIPGGADSIFTNPSCPAGPKGQPEARCLQIDNDHAIAVGTSMSAPMVAGALALLFQRDRTLTQDKLVTLLQAGAHPFRGSAPYEDQGGPGELDVQGALDAYEAMQNPALALPSARTSWLTLDADFAAADGSMPVVAIVELRTLDGVGRPDLFDATRLALTATVGDTTLAAPTLTRRGPGLWTASVALAPGYGGQALTVGATFDGQPIVSSRIIPVATDSWSADYPPDVKGGCAMGQPGGPWAWLAALGIPALAVWRRRRALSRGKGPPRAERTGM